MAVKLLACAVIISCQPSTTARSPDAHAMLTVNAGTSSPSPARHAICRAGFGPTPAGRALPKITSSTRHRKLARDSRPPGAYANSPGARSGGSGNPNARSSAARTAVVPKSGCVNSTSAPPNFPIGVRTALRI